MNLPFIFSKHELLLLVMLHIFHLYGDMKVEAS